MIKSQISIDDAVNLLNEMIEVDTPAIAALIANRVPCNRTLADHETIQCGSQHGGYWVGMLGVINGLFGVDDEQMGAIGAVFKDGNLIQFQRNK